MSLYYTDDRLLTGENKIKVQETMNLTTKVFNKFGLKMNETKSKMMIICVGYKKVKVCSDVFKRRIGGDGMSFAEKQKYKVKCGICEKWSNLDKLKNI